MGWLRDKVQEAQDEADAVAAMHTELINRNGNVPPPPLQERMDKAAAKVSRALEFLHTERFLAMGDYLRDKQTSWEDMSSVINCLGIQRTSQGFIDPRSNKSLTTPGRLFSSFDGYTLSTSPQER